jgi:hypothetical protein
MSKCEKCGKEITVESEWLHVHETDGVLHTQERCLEVRLADAVAKMAELQDEADWAAVHRKRITELTMKETALLARVDNLSVALRAAVTAWLGFLIVPEHQSMSLTHPDLYRRIGLLIDAGHPWREEDKLTCCQTLQRVMDILEAQA